MDRMSKMKEEIEDGEFWWARYVFRINKRHLGKVAIGCALNPNEPLTSKRRYVE